MNLDSITYGKIANIFKTPCNCVEYSGCWGANQISFFRGTIDENGNKTSGIHLAVNENFEIQWLRRITGYGIASVKGYNLKEFRWKLPLHPNGQKIEFYQLP